MIAENNGKPTRRSALMITGVRQSLEWTADKPFRILSIDGGGIKGIFPASLLSIIEREICDRGSVGNYFDMITGTSTGGIISLALALGHSADQILEIYTENGADIFPAATGFARGFRQIYDRRIRGLWRYKYEPEPLREHLTHVFGDRLLGHATRRLCIPAFDGNYNEVHVFKTPHHPDFRIDWEESAVDVALATAAAPTFFPVHRSKGRQFADGGIWANNPIMIGLVDALACYSLPRRSVHILSLGCGEREMAFTKGQQIGGGLWHWRAVIEAAMSLQSQSAEGQARALIGTDHLLRIGPSGPAAVAQMDDFQTANALLPEEAQRAFEQNLSALKLFFFEPADPFTAFHGPRAAAWRDPTSS